MYTREDEASTGQIEKAKDFSGRRWRTVRREFPELAIAYYPLSRNPRHATDPRALAMIAEVLGRPDFRKAVRRLMTMRPALRRGSAWRSHNWLVERDAVKIFCRLAGDYPEVRYVYTGCYCNDDGGQMKVCPRRYAGTRIVRQFLAGLAFDDVAEKFARTLRMRRTSPSHFDSGIMAEGVLALAAKPFNESDRHTAVGELIAGLATVPDAREAAAYLIGGGGLMDIPDKLKTLPNWVNWKPVERNGATTKIPVQPNGQPAKSNDPATWSSYDDVAAASGLIGFVFAAGDNLFGIDLDECVSDDGEVSAWAMEIVERFPAAYVETSPSGRGLKLFCGGADVIKGRSKKLGEKIGDRKAKGIELYGRGRFFTVTRRAFQDGGVGDCSDGLAWLMERHFPEKTPATSPAVPVSYDRTTGQVDVERRALRYLETCDPVVSGSGGHNQTYSVCARLVHGFLLSPEQAFHLLAEWNARCSPPWSEADLRRKCEQAAAGACSRERGWLLHESREDTPAASAVDLSGFGNEAASEPAAAVAVEDDSEPAGPAAPGDFPAAALDGLPGVIGEVVAYNLATTDAPQPQLALAGALALVGVLTGRKVKDYRNTSTNVFVVAFAPSGAGKNHSRGINKRLLSQGNAAALLGNERIASHSGILARLADQPATLMMVDEIGDLFSTMKAGGSKTGHLKNIESVLKQFYSSAGDDDFVGDAYANLSHVKSICQPHLVLYGSCTPSGFWGNLTADNVENGMLARMMVFEAAGYSAPTMNDPAESDPPKTVLEWVRNWYVFHPGDGKLNPTPALVSYQDDASEAFRLHKFQVQERRQREDERTAATWSRTPEKTAKLAMLFACARVYNPAAEPVVVTLDDVERAKRNANYMTRRIVYQVFETVADNAEEARKKRLLKIIGIGRRVSLSVITNGTKTMNRNERNNALADLQAGGLVACERVETGGKPRIEYWRIRG